MGFLDKVFGKKDDDLGLDDNFSGSGSDIPGQLPDNPPGYGQNYGQEQGYNQPPRGMPSEPGQPQNVKSNIQSNLSPEDFGFEKADDPRQSSGAGYPGRQQGQSLSEINLGKDIEIMSAKLDSIKAELDSINQRVKRIERIAEGESNNHKDKWSY